MFGIFRRDEPGDAAAPGQSDDLLELRAELEEFRIRVAAAGRRLPPGAHVRVGCIAALLRTILARAGSLAPTSDEMLIVSRSIRDYLPTSVDAFLALPPGYANRTLPGRSVPAKEELVSQLELLERELERVADVFHRSDAQALANQGRFLEDRFHSSALDLP